MASRDGGKPFLRSPIRSADDSLSEVLRAFDARQALAKASPLEALAFRTIALAEGRADCDVCQASLVTMLGEEARRALKASGIPLDKLNALYPSGRVAE